MKQRTYKKGLIVITTNFCFHECKKFKDGCADGCTLRHFGDFIKNKDTKDLEALSQK